MRSIVVSLALALLASVACSEAERCFEHPSPYYNQALAKSLSAKGVASSVQPGRGVCYPASAQVQFKQSEAELNRYFYEVADTLRDKCEEAAYVEWATREKLPFEIHDTTSSGGPPGRMINIYSFSAEEVAANHKKLDEAPRGKRCS